MTSLSYILVVILKSPTQITDVAHATEDEDYVTDGEAIVQAADAAADKMSLLFKQVFLRL